jgi:subtilisin family serine protease
MAAGALPAAAAEPPASATHTATASANDVNPAEWWLSALRVPAAAGKGSAPGKGVTVAVLSTGVDATHPDLTGQVTTGPDFSGTGRKQGTPFWGAEGTAVASLIAGHGDRAQVTGTAGTAEGITGVAPGARIESVQVTVEYNDPLAAQAAVTQKLPDAIAAGIRWAVGHGASVIALPLDPRELAPPAAGSTAAGSTGAGNSTAGGSAAEKAAVSYALARNVVLVAPAGDNGAKGNAVNYPAAYPGVVTVGATTRTGQLAPFSATGAYVTLTAPGSGSTPAAAGAAMSGMTANPAAGLTVAAPGGGYETLASSDMSAALTAGVAALIRARYPQLTAAEVAQALGHGQLDAATAVSRAGTTAAALPQPTPFATVQAPGTPQWLSASPTATPLAADPGRLLRRISVDLAVGAGALIVLLASALWLTWLRRRKRTVRALGPGRHAKGQPLPQASIPARVVIRPSAQPTPPTALAGRQAPPLTSGILQKQNAQQRRQTVQEEQPPWPPATPPGSHDALHTVLPAQVMPAAQPEKPLAPWERSPEEFAVAPPTDEAVWPLTNSGPLYVWNPATSTGPIIVGRRDER